MFPRQLFLPVAAVSLSTVLAASTTKTSTSTTSFLLPSRSTSSGYHIYATPITSDASTTEYLLACQTQFGGSSYSCGGDFTGLTLTYGPSTMHVNMGPLVGLEYDCALSSTAVCTVTSSGIVASSTVLSLAAADTSRSITAVTILDDGRAKGTGVKTSSSTTVTTGTVATVTSSTTGSGSGAVCKRKVGSSNGGGGGNGATATGGDAATTTGSGSGDSCSGGSKGEVGMIVGGALALAAVLGMGI